MSRPDAPAIPRGFVRVLAVLGILAVLVVFVFSGGRYP